MNGNFCFFEGLLEAKQRSVRRSPFWYKPFTYLLSKVTILRVHLLLWMDGMGMFLLYFADYLMLCLLCHSVLNRLIVTFCKTGSAFNLHKDME